MIYLIRHGETDGNKLHYVGRQDLPLNDTGRAQARAIAALLADRPITQVVASPLCRAIQTASPLASALALCIESASALMEIDFGQLQNAPKADRALNLRKLHATQPLPGGESLRDVWDRLLPLARRLHAAQHSGSDTVIVGHYWSNRMLHGLLSGQSFMETVALGHYKPATGSVTALESTELLRALDP